jgi:anthranilate synthase/aminodeoxychorismate synthase-like glutamine amidotransferase
MKVLFIDNFDSFTYNLVDEFAKRDSEVLVYRNDIPMTDLRELVDSERPELLVISPGPATPARAGVCLEAVRELAGKLPIFGVCLGHQIMVEAFGGQVGRAPLPVHGKVGLVEHDGRGIFQGQPDPMPVGRYHSLVGLEVPEVLEVSARCGELVMGIRHLTLPLAGVQFHPESILTPSGGLMVERVIDWARHCAGAPG